MARSPWEPPKRPRAFNDLNTWGWVLVVLGALQILAAFSIWRGGMYGRIVGVLVPA